MTRALISLLALAGLCPAAQPPAEGERIALIGNGLGERLLDHPWLEVELQLRFPDKQLVVRNLCRPGNTAGFRPHPSRKSQWAFPGAEQFHPQHRIHHGTGHHPTPDQWLTTVGADTILAFFGYNESFDGEAGLENFRGELDAFITHTLAQKYNGDSAPRLVLVSPIAYEDLSASRDLPDGSAENERLAQYTAVMKEVATAREVGFIDLFHETARLYPTFEGDFTRNGFLPTDAGYRLLGPALADAAFGKTKRASQADPETLAEAVRDKNWYWFQDYRMLNGVHVDGRRYKPFGPDNYPAETEKVRAMTQVRDTRIHALLRGEKLDLIEADSRTPALPEVQTNYKPSNKNGTPEYVDPVEAVDSFILPEGYEISLFASEFDFPNLANPVQLSFDDRGRLWVATMPSYPHYRPGDTRPDDKLLIYEDTNGDGRADKETVFADGLHVPTGFEFAPEGVYVAQNPHLVLLRDTDGDDRADSSELILTGFDTHDTHHAPGAFCADPSGAFYMAEGVFLHSNVETPYGPVRGVDGGFYRFSPQRTRLERTAQLSIPNPWGVAVDDWGQPFFLHTSGPSINWMLPVSLKTPYGEKNPGTINLAPKGNAVRPTSGIEIVSSSHFPAEVQGDLLVCNTIGFRGIKQHQLEDDGTGYKTTFRQDLLKSEDGNFRPVDLEFAPDGSLYVVDWHNALIGHMQHNARDPLRDHVHGRLWRITRTGSPLVEPPAVEGAPVASLLENLKHPDSRLRYRTRRELRAHKPETVLPALSAWLEKLDPQDPRHPHHQLEALWVSWGANRIDTALLRELLGSPDFRVRAAAVHALRYNTRDFPDHSALLMAAATDAHGRVRLEAVAAATWLEDKGVARQIVDAAAAKPLDNWSKKPTETAAARLAGEQVEIAEGPPAPTPPTRLDPAARARFLKGHEIYHREGHCVTCHQPDGKGLPATGFPPIAGTYWAQGNEERLIKLTLHGLLGPIEIDGVSYPGHVPMTPFGGMLDDEEIASVLTYIRNHFGNEAPPVAPEKVAEVRKATGTRGFYSPEELLKEHPEEP